MKKLFALLGVFGLFFIASCEKDEEAEECHECHIAYHMEHDDDECCVEGGDDACCGDHHDHEEIEGEIGEFCGDELADVEANGYVLTEDLVVGDHVIPAGTYSASEVHCEEHAH